MHDPRRTGSDLPFDGTSHISDTSSHQGLKDNGRSSQQSVMERVRIWFRGLGASWTFEVLAMMGSVIGQGAIIAILVFMQDKELIRWKSAVSINAMVSALTTAAKSLMLFAVAGCLGQLKWIYFHSQPRQLYHLELFDELGKGPLGALQIVLRVRWAAAYLGVAIVVLALAFDPFAQQVVNFENRDVTLPDPTVSFGITHNYSASGPWNAFGALISQ